MGQKSLNEVLLHPVRWRIVRAFFGRELTTSQLLELVSDVPVTSLYRHVSVLTEAGVLEVVNQRQVRGAVERTYRLDSSKQAVDEAGAATMSADDHRRAFQILLARVAVDLDEYLSQGPIDPVADHVNYSQAALYVTGNDMIELQSGFRELLTPYLSAEGRSGEGIRRMMLTTILLPDEPLEDRSSRAPDPPHAGIGPEGREHA